MFSYSHDSTVNRPLNFFIELDKTFASISSMSSLLDGYLSAGQSLYALTSQLTGTTVSSTFCPDQAYTVVEVVGGEVLVQRQKLFLLLPHRTQTSRADVSVFLGGGMPPATPPLLPV